MNRPVVYNNEGIKAKNINPVQQLRRSVMACMLWENSFYEDGESIADRICETIKLVKPEVVAEMAIDAREKFKLRHVPLLMVREMARLPSHRSLVSATLQRIIQRPDELAEFLAIYWKQGKQPLSAQVKKGLATAFQKFEEYALAKYNRDGPIKLRDVLFLCHAKPKDKAQEKLWKRLINKELKTPDTWEVALSSGEDKAEVFTRLIKEEKLGSLALLRNLRNIEQSGVKKTLVANALESMDTSRVLPFRFIAAARAVPQWEDIIEKPLQTCLENTKKLKGKTILLVDISPSMKGEISGKSDLTRKDAAFALAVILREICSSVEIWSFAQECKQVAPRRGFALADAINNAVPSNGTLIGNAVMTVTGRYDRLIVITDEESQDAVPNPDSDRWAYMINVSSSKNGIGYGPWTHFDGWSEQVINYIQEFEQK